jgi:ribosomal protein S18 acetylase RimI-like enzyme
MEPNVQVIAHGSALYLEAVELRRSVLRVPLGLDFSDTELAAEAAPGHIHLAAVAQQEVVGYVMLLDRGDGAMKMRQLAVEPRWQSKGIGTQLVRFAEELARQRGGDRIILNARETAVPFYDKFGYHPEGERFTEVTLPHWRMVKSLAG